MTEPTRAAPAAGAGPGVLYVGVTAQLGGAERVLLACVDAALANAIPVRGVLLLTDGDGPLVAELAARGVATTALALPQRAVRLGSSSVGARLRAGAALPLLLPGVAGYLLKLRRHFAQLPPGTRLHAHGLKAGLFTALAAPAGTTVVWHVHDFLSRRGRLALVLLRLAAARVTRAVAVSQAVADDLAVVLPGLSATVLPNAVSAAYVTTAAPVRATAASPVANGRASASSAAPPLLVGLVATFGHWKGHDLFLDAAARLLAARPGAARFLVVGGAVYATGSAQADAAALRRRAEALGLGDAVEFLPFDPDLRVLYERLDVVVNASTAPEPFGMTLIEGMARGCAAVVPAEGGPPEILDGGSAGLLYAPRDAAALAAALLRLVDDPAQRAQFAARGAARVRARYAPAAYARGLAALYAAL